MEVRTTLKLSYLQETKEAIKNAIISKGQAVADTDTFRSYAEKIAAIETDSASSVTEVFPETELPFALNPDYGLYVWSAIDNVFPLVEGKEYVVVWDGTAYTCTAKSAVFITSAGVGVGNFAMAGIGENTGEPFLLGVTADGSAVLCFTTETDESHTVRIYQKASAGGGVEVCYVTFMSEDGLTELYKKAVISGDNCMNPVEMGWLETPVKTPTNTIAYTFDGWSATAGGSADNSLDKVSADKTVYAAYTAGTRYYTVRFFDGETLLNTMQVEYGGTANYTTTKDGVMFNGWKPSNENIVADTDCYAQFIQNPLITDSWEEITAAVADGSYKTKYYVGQYKELDVGTEGTVRMQIAAMDSVCELADGSGYAPITWISMDLLSTDMKMLESGGGDYASWRNSLVRTHLNTTVKALLPLTLQENIKTRRWTSRYFSSSTSQKDAVVDDDLWLPTSNDIGFILGKFTGIFPDEASRIRCKAGTETPIIWWTASPVSSSTAKGYQYSCISESGSNVNKVGYTNMFGIILCFCI